MNNLLQIISESLKELGQTFKDSFFGNDNNHSLDASFGNSSKLLSTKNKGFCLDGKRSISLKQSRSNALVVAPSGKGKTQVSIFPFLLNFTGQSSLLINDVSGELAQAIPYLNSIGVTTGILDFGKKTGLYFNPLDGCKGNISQMKKVAQTLMRASSGNSDKQDFWTISGADNLVLFIQYILESEEPEFHNLGNVYRLILEYQGSPKTIQTMMAKKASPEVWAKFKSLAGASENTRKSIVASSLAALSFIGDDPMLCDITSFTNINFEAFREKSHALFVQVPVSDTAYYAPILSLFFQEFYRFAFSRIPSSEELDIMMVLDEFDTLTAIDGFSSIISNSRKFGIPQLLVLQGESQLSKYGKQQTTILNNCNVKCYFGGLGEEVYQLEKILGKFEYNPDKGDKKFTRERSLMTASEIREMKNEILILPSGEKPLKVTITESYKQSKLMKRLKMKPQEEEKKNTQFNIQYIPLEEYKKNKTETITKTKQP
jgi:type IV secretory pathway TraG/TraD family ATPase VirD4